MILTEISADAPCMAAALLHDTIEDSDASREEIASVFGEEVALLVDGVTKINTIIDGAERPYKFTYSGNYVSSIQAPDGTVSFGLGGDGQLQSVTYPGDTNASTIITYNNIPINSI